MDEIEQALKNKTTILADIQALIKTSEGSTRVLDAIMHYCEKNNIEPEIAAEAIKTNQNIIASLRIEAENLNYLQKTSRLPI